MLFKQRIREVRRELDAATARRDLRTLLFVKNEVAYLRGWPAQNGLAELLEAMAERAASVITQVACQEACRLADRVGYLLNTARREMSAARGEPQEGRLRFARRHLVRAERLLGLLEMSAGVDAGRAERLRAKLGLAKEELTAAESRIVRARMVLGGMIKYRACDSKRAYRSEAEAHAAKNKYTYVCPYCGQWHATSRPKPKARRRK